jgi:hypothetical protein
MNLQYKFQRILLSLDYQRGKTRNTFSLKRCIKTKAMWVEASPTNVLHLVRGLYLRFMHAVALWLHLFSVPLLLFASCAWDLLPHDYLHSEVLSLLLPLIKYAPWKQQCYFPKNFVELRLWCSLLLLLSLLSFILFYFLERKKDCCYTFSPLPRVQQDLFVSFLF